MKRKIAFYFLIALSLLTISRDVLAAGLTLEFGGKPEFRLRTSPRMAEAENVRIFPATDPTVVQGGSDVFFAASSSGLRAASRDAGGAGGSENAKAIFVIAIGALVLAGCGLLIAGAVSSS